MEILIPGLIAVVVWVARLLFDDDWNSVAADMDLVYLKTWTGGRQLYGYLRGFDVRVEEVSDGNHGKRLLAKVSGLDPGFTLGPDSALRRMIKPDIETGDHLFDERTRIEGDADWALALLGADARRLTEIVISGWNGSLKGQTLVASFKGIGATASTLDALLDLAQLLRPPSDHELPKLLMERACHDPSAPVRLQAFRRLASAPAFRDEAHVAAEKLIGSSSAFLRLEACRLLVNSSPERSALAVEGLAVLATRNHVDTSVRRSALETLIESGRQEAAITAMTEIRRQLDTVPWVRTAALEGLVKVGARRELLECRIEGEIEAEILARGLGHFDSSVQPRLLELLEDSGERVRLAAVRSLGRVGDLEAIRALRQIAGKDRLFKSALAREAEVAIDNIKSRSDGSQQGELSIITVAPLEGAISPADDSEAGGEVSLTS